MKFLVCTFTTFRIIKYFAASGTAIRRRSMTSATSSKTRKCQQGVNESQTLLFILSYQVVSVHSITKFSLARLSIHIFCADSYLRCIFFSNRKSLTLTGINIIEISFNDRHYGLIHSITCHLKSLPQTKHMLTFINKCTAT